MFRIDRAGHNHQLLGVGGDKIDLTALDSFRSLFLSQRLDLPSNSFYSYIIVYCMVKNLGFLTSCLEFLLAGIPSDCQLLLGKLSVDQLAQHPIKLVHNQLLPGLLLEIIHLELKGVHQPDSVPKPKTKEEE